MTVTDGKVSGIPDKSKVVLRPSAAEIRKVKSIKIKTVKSEKPVKTVAQEKPVAKLAKKEDLKEEPQVKAQVEPPTPVKEVAAQPEIVQKVDSWPLGEVTKEHIGRVIATNGRIYSHAKDAQTDKTFPAAVITYLTTDSLGKSHGMAIALEDASKNPLMWKEAADAVKTWAASYAIPNTTWRLPTVEDIKNLDADGKLFKLLKAETADQDNLSQFYWTAVENDQFTAWCYHFRIGQLQTGNKTYSFCIRPVLVF